MASENEKIKQLEEALKADKALKKNYDAIMDRIRDNKEADSEQEAMVKAASELGFDISIEELERMFASIQDASDEELESVVGGKDEHGHSDWCLVTWHCYGAFLHTETDGNPEKRGPHETREACWSNFHCYGVSHRDG